MPDLFALLEGLFRGLVFVFYNAIGTAGTLFRHPFRGPAYLEAAYRMKGRRQLGGVTFMFLTLLFLYGLCDFAVSPGRRDAAGEDLITALQGFGGDMWWPALVVGIASTVLIDSALRLVLLKRFGGRRRLLARYVTAVEFAAFLPILASGIVAVFIWLVLFTVGTVLPVGEGQWLFLAVAAPPGIIASLPAAGLIRAAWTVGKAPVDAGVALRSARIRPARRGRALIAIAFGLWVFLSVAVGLRLQVAPLVHRLGLKPVRVLAMRCSLDSEPPSVEAVLRNDGGEAVVVDLRQYSLSVGDEKMEEHPFGYTDYAHPSYALRPWPGTAAYFALEPGSTAVIRADLPEAARRPLRARPACILHPPMTAHYFIPGRRFDATDDRLETIGVIRFPEAEADANANAAADR